MPLGLALLSCSLSIAVVATSLLTSHGVVARGLGGLLVWLSVSLAWLAVAYLTRRPGLLGKRSDGRVAAWATALLAPYLVLQYGLSLATRRFGREPRVQEIAPGVVIGGWPLAADVPEDVAHVVDLTAEFAVAPGVTVGRRYTAFPLLDATASSTEDLAALVADVVDDGRPVLIHCAQGHGRSALVVACVLLARGDARDAEDAVARIRAVRPLVRLKRGQRAALDDFERRRAARPSAQIV